MFDAFLIDRNFIHDAALVFAAFILLAAAVSDLKQLKISNKLCIALAALFPLYVLTAPGEIAWLHHAAIAALVFIIGFALFALRLIGAGDIKMLTAAALWAGPKLIATLLIYTSLAGGLLAIGFAAAALFRAMLKKQQANEGDVPWHKAPVPYGVAIACGGISALVMLAQSSLT